MAILEKIAVSADKNSWN